MANLTLLQINDTHGYLEAHPEIRWSAHGPCVVTMGGFARIATIFADARSQGEALAFDNGDTWSGRRRDPGRSKHRGSAERPGPPSPPPIAGALPRYVALGVHRRGAWRDRGHDLRPPLRLEAGAAMDATLLGGIANSPLARGQPTLAKAINIAQSQTWCKGTPSKLTACSMPALRVDWMSRGLGPPRLIPTSADPTLAAKPDQQPDCD
jgi:hypothetical protein